MGKLNIGDPAPSFSLLNQDRKTISYEDYLGKKNLVVYFYPKDETPGCVKEACSFRDSYEAFTDAGAEVIGISADNVDSHNAFATNRRLPFQLLSDPDHAVSKAFGVEKSGFGLFPGRETFVIDKKGTIRMRFASALNINKHIDSALKVIQEL